MPYATPEGRIWAIAGRCSFCDMLIVWVERPNRPERKDLPVILSTWDGNPVYDSRVHQRHRCRLRQKLLKLRGEWKPPRLRYA